MSLTLMHLGDLHLGAQMRWLGERAAERRNDLSKAFSRAVDYALEHVDLVLLAGDIFDHHRPREEAISFFRSQVLRLEQSGIPAVAVPGNHDGYFYPESVWRTREFPGLTLITSPEIKAPVTLDIRGIAVHIYGLAYQPMAGGGSIEALKRTDNRGVHLALIHGSLMHSPEWNVRRQDIPLDPKRLANSGMDYIALGHYHRFTRTDIQGIPVVYCGTLEGYDLQEAGAKFLVTVTFDQGKVELQTQEFQSRVIHDLRVDVTGWEESGAEEVTKHVIGLLEKTDDIYQITLEGTAAEVIDLERVRAQVAERCFFVQLNDHTTLLAAAAIDRIGREPTVRGGFVRAVRKRIQEDSSVEAEVAELALRIGLRQFMEGEKR